MTGLELSPRSGIEPAVAAADAEAGKPQGETLEWMSKSPLAGSIS
jgi:hypothetical protein